MKTGYLNMKNNNEDSEKLYSGYILKREFKEHKKVFRTKYNE